MRAPSRQPLAVLLGLAVGLALPAPAAADDAIGQVTCPGGTRRDARQRGCGSISAYGGWVAWSSYDTTTSAYVLWTKGDGAAAPAPVSASRRSFDIDLGPDRD